MVHARLLQAFSGWRHHFLKFCHNEATKHEMIEHATPKRYGQPTPLTHPQILKVGEVTPGITQEEYRCRRHRLMELIGKTSAKLEKKFDHHVVVIPSAVKRFMSEAIPYVFHQNNDFLYSCGFQEPNGVLVMISTNDSTSSNRSWIFVEQGNSHSEMWDGPRTGPGGAAELLGVDESLPIDQFQNFVLKFLNGKKSVALWYDFGNVVNPNINKVMKVVVDQHTNCMLQSPRLLMQHLRLQKSPAEIKLMQQANKIASDAFVETIRSTQLGSSEHHVHAKMEYECKIRGANYLAYPPVVAGGSRATTIHYIQNDQTFSNGDMVLMDAGCYYYGYVSDITRTWPVNGKFNPYQKILYEVVLEVQQQLLAELKATRHSLDQLYMMMCHLLGQKLQEIGIIPQAATSTAVATLAQEFCPHHVGHYLGMDVHDCALIPRHIVLEPGVVVTVEPGVYVSKNNKKVPAEFRGLGIRIEDNVVITESGCLNLTWACPKEVEKLENLMQE